MRVLVTGGAGFADGNVAVHAARRDDWDVVALDNLHRSGSDRPSRSVTETVADVDAWLVEHEEALRAVLR